MKNKKIPKQQLAGVTYLTACISTNSSCLFVTELGEADCLRLWNHQKADMLFKLKNNVLNVEGCILYANVTLFSWLISLTTHSQFLTLHNQTQIYCMMALCSVLLY